VQTLSEDVSLMLETFRESLAQQAEAGRAERPEAIKKARVFVRDLRETVEQMKADFARERSENQQTATQERVDFIRGVQSSVRDLIDEAHAARARRQQDLEALRGAVASIREDAAPDATSASSTPRSTSSAPSVADAPSAAKASVTETPSPAETASPTSTEAPGSATRGSKSKTTRSATKKQPASETPSADDSEAPVDTSNPKAQERSAGNDAAPEADDAEYDNLAVIQGIGPKMAFRLREKGLRTFEDLATASADEIRKLMGGLPSFADVDSWIEQAQSQIDPSEVDNE